VTPRFRDVKADSTVSPAAMSGGIVAGMLLVALGVAAVTRPRRRNRA
jgi:MYXO-CTERM domain-containing protein